MNLKTISTAAVLALSLAACAMPGAYRERRDADLERFEKHAGQPVDRINAFMGVDRWRLLSTDKLVIWTSVNRAYLMTLRGPCSGLEFQQAIGISSTNKVIDRRFDKIHFENQLCYIGEIRPVDYKAMKQERRAEKEAS